MSSKLFQGSARKAGIGILSVLLSVFFLRYRDFGIYAGCDRASRRTDADDGKENAGAADQDDNRRRHCDRQRARSREISFLAMESTDSRMNRLAKGEFYFGRYNIPLDEIINSLEKVHA